MAGDFTKLSRPQRAPYGGGEKLPVEPPRDQRDIEAAFSDLCVELDGLMSAIIEAEDRLRPVLAPSGPEKEALGRPQQAAGSFVLGQVFAATSALSQRTARLREITSRVEL